MRYGVTDTLGAIGVAAVDEGATIVNDVAATGRRADRGGATVDASGGPRLSSKGDRTDDVPRECNGATLVRAALATAVAGTAPARIPPPTHGDTSGG